MPATPVRSKPQSAPPDPPAPAAAGKNIRSGAVWALYLVVFSCGAILMGIEIAGSRILAPHFGTSIFVWGSLIGLFMAAMALGYYVGGRLADWKPSFAVLAGIVCLAGLYTFLIPYFGLGLCEAVARNVAHRALGPLLASGVLFFIPSFLLATVSPFAVKLHARSLAELGGVAGKLYALSTAGSIVGTLVTTFFFIPLAQTSNVMMGLGLGLISAALAGMVLFQAALRQTTALDRNAASVIILLILVCVESWLFVPAAPRAAASDRLLYFAESSYHDISVTEEVVQHDRTLGKDGREVVRWRIVPPSLVKRWMKFNEMRESGIYPYRSEYLNAVTYSNLMHLASLWIPQPKRILVVGGGGGVVPAQYALHYPSLEKADVLELDAEVRTAAERYFQLPGGGKIEFHIGDARMLLRRTAGSYDIIFLDAYSAGGQIPFHLLTWEFLRECRQRLSPQGVLVTNIISAVVNQSGRPFRGADLLFAELRTLKASEAETFGLKNPTPEQQTPLFRQAYVFPKRHWNSETVSTWEQARERNVIVVATRETTPRAAGDLAALADRMNSGSDPAVKVKSDPFEGPAPWLLAGYQATAFGVTARGLYLGVTEDELHSVPILRDDYAPVDTMYRPLNYEERTTLLR